MRNPYRDILLACILILISRIPFLFFGYGSEEDAWGLILTGRKIALSGIYEVSRMPGHPIQEYLLSLIWHWPSWLLNLLTALVSTAGIGFFMVALKRLAVKHYLEAGVALAFVPAVFLNSSNVMDYTWAMALTMCAFFFSTHKKPLAAGLILGIAAGFRVTALGMAMPLALMFFTQTDRKAGIRQVFLFWSAAALVAVIAFLPPYITYGPAFFMYYQYFPDPPMLKNIYKATIGAWGTIGCIALAVAAAAAWRSYRKNQQGSNEKLYLLMCFIVMAMYLYAYIKLPQKSAFVIPAAPFVIMALAMLLEKRGMRLVAAAMLVSSFLFGINLDDPNRGSERSALSAGFSVAGSSAAIDVLYGPVVADVTKRKNKIRYAKRVSDTILASGKKTLLIAGWFQNEIEYYLLDKERTHFITSYYSDRSELQSYRDQGYEIWHLPEQDVYNDLRYNGTFTSAFSSPFPDPGP